MIRLRVGVIAIIIATFAQWFLLEQKGFLHSDFPFLDGVPTDCSERVKINYLVIWFIPISVIGLYFSGWFTDFLSKYGTYTLIRGKDRTKFFISRYMKLVLSLLTFVLCQCTTMIVINFIANSSIVFPQIELVTMYVMTLLVIFTAQITLDLFAPAQVSLLITYIAVILLSYFPFIDVDNRVYLFLPSYGMGFRNGLSSLEEFTQSLVSIPIGFTILSVVLLILMTFNLRRIKKIDLF